MQSPLAEFVFRENGRVFVPLLDALCAEMKSPTYRFMDAKKFEEMIANDIRTAQKIYWQEILQRAHLSVWAALLRHHRWVSGVLLAAQANNFIAFASAFRGLIESAADAYYSLADVPMTLAEYRGKILLALEGKLDAVLLAGVLEERLIHFMYARKIEKGEVVADYHKAKSAREYLSELQQANEGLIHTCYSELCQITHPARLSVLSFIAFKGEDELELRTDADQGNIRAFCAKHQNAVPRLFQHGLNPALLVLKLLNHFPRAELYTHGFLDSVSVDHIQPWPRIMKAMSQ